MPVCDQCGQADVSQDCSYCGDTFCREHRLPENHDCPGLKNRRVSAQIGAGASEGAFIGRVEEEDDDQVDLSEHRPEPDVTMSPGTNLDGSIETSEQPEQIDRDQPDKPSSLERVKVTLDVQWNRSGAATRTLVRALGVGLVLLGAFNFFVPFFGTEQVLTQYYSYLPGLLSEIALMAVGAAVVWFV
jgi:hypothetical protein